MEHFYSKVAGVTDNTPDGTNRQKIIAKYVKVGTKLKAIPEPNNEFNENAIGLWFTKKDFWGRKRIHLGFILDDIACRLSGEMQNGKEVEVTVKDITSSSDKSLGLDIIIDAWDIPLR